MNIKNFLEEIHPGGTIYVSTQKYILDEGKLKKEQWIDTKCGDLETALQKITKSVKDDCNVYHSMASFTDDSKGRKTENAKSFCSFFIDVDSGPDAKKKYKTISECEDAICSFFSTSNVPYPSIIVCSGNGYHCYWVLSEVVTVDEWLPVAEALKEVCLKGNLHIDKAPTADSARVLRTINSKNYKDPDNPKLVEVVYPEEKTQIVRYSFRDISKIFYDELSMISTNQILLNDIKVDAASMDTLDSLEAYPKTNLQDLTKILSKIDPNCSREVWLNIGMGCVEEFGDLARDAFGKWSAGCFHEKHDYGNIPPSNYDDNDIKSQWTDWLNRKDNGKTGITFGTVLWHANNNGSHLTLSNNFFVLRNERILGDRQNGQLFASEYRGVFLYINFMAAWFRWNNIIWEECLAGEEVAAAKKISDSIADVAVMALKEDSHKAKAILSHAMKAQNSPHIKSMIDLAKSEPQMSEPNASRLNKDPHLIGVLNGVVDLRLGELIKPEPEMLITKQCKANYLKGSPCDLWLAFLSQIFNDQATIDSIQRIVGYTFTGCTTEEIIVICHGYGANGKSVLSNVLQKIAGDYGKTGSSNLLKARKSDDTGPRPDIAALYGARYISVNEMESGDHLDEQVVKILASRESICARHLYRNEFSFSPAGVIWLKTNHKPIIKGEDDGIWRRLVLIPFDRKFSEEERDKDLEEKLLMQSDGILEWVVEGAVKWYQSGLKLSKKIKDQSASYRSESDLLGQFLEDTTIPDMNGRAIDSGVYFDYSTWCQNNGTKPLSKKRFTQKLDERGYPMVKSDGKRYYSGIKLKDSILQELSMT